MRKLDLESVKFSMPKREYCDGEKKMMTMRIPKKLDAELEKLAKEWGWPVSDLKITALDQFLQWARKKKRDE